MKRQYATRLDPVTIEQIKRLAIMNNVSQAEVIELSVRRLMDLMPECHDNNTKCHDSIGASHVSHQR